MLKIATLFAILILSFASFHSVFAFDGTQRAEIKNPRLVNSFGEAIVQNVNTGQQVQITADVINQQSTDQTFVYIVQIVDGSDVTMKLTWIAQIELNPHQSFSPAISWTPVNPGTYTAEIYVWDSIKDANALAPQTNLTIIVS